MEDLPPSRDPKAGFLPSRRSKRVSQNEEKKKKEENGPKIIRKKLTQQNSTSWDFGFDSDIEEETKEEPRLSIGMTQDKNAAKNLPKAGRKGEKRVLEENLPSSDGRSSNPNQKPGEELEKRVAILEKQLKEEKKKREADQQAFSNMKEEFIKLKKEMEEKDEMNWLLKKNVKKVQEKVFEQAKFIWEIQNVADIHEGKNFGVSEVFLSNGTNGYNMEAVLFLTKKAQGNYFSIGFRLVPGPEDDNLDWPFKEAVKFKLRPPPGSEVFPMFAVTEVKELPRPEEKEKVEIKDFPVVIEKFLRIQKDLADYMWDKKVMVVDVGLWGFGDF